MNNAAPFGTADYENKPAAYFAETRPEMLRFVPVGCGVVLDVGCGGGGFGLALKQRGAGNEVWGVEMVAEAARVAAKRLDRVLVGTFAECRPQLPESAFDCVIFNDVLEHLDDPEQVLRETIALLRPGGVVVASIPNVRYFDVVHPLVLHGRWDYQDWGVLDRTHRRFFTRHSIVETFTRCGYNPEFLEGINPKRLGWKWVMLNLLTRRRFEEIRYQQFAVRARPRP